MSTYERRDYIPHDIRVYRPHMTCFRCRVSLKSVPTCPYCRQPMVNMGFHFRSPRRNDMREWKRLHEKHLARLACAAARAAERDFKENRRLAFELAVG